MYHEKKKEKGKSLKKELARLKKEGIYLEINGEPGSPEKISRAHKLAENGTYMRDYIADEKGGIKEVHFQWVKNEVFHPIGESSPKKRKQSK